MSLSLEATLLLASGTAYYCAILLPHPSTRNIENRTIERISFFLTGSIILSLVYLSHSKIFNAWWAWMSLGIFYVMASMLSYFGYSKWNVLWQEEISDAAQMSMWLWDLAIAISAFRMM